MRLRKFFFDAPAVEVAKKLIGCTLRYVSSEGEIGGILSETEAYTEEDPASHSFQGRITSRNQSMFQEGGHLYVYRIYGMHHCANLVTDRVGFGSAVLLRSMIPTIGIDLMRKNRKYLTNDLKNLCNGPGKLCQALGWDLSFNGFHAMDDGSLITIYSPSTPLESVRATPRIGISKGQDLLWRFLWQDG